MNNNAKRPSLLLVIGYLILSVTFIGAIGGLVYLRANWLQTMIDILNANGGMDGQTLTIEGIKNSSEMINAIAELIGKPVGISFDELVAQGNLFFSTILITGIVVYGAIMVIATLGLFSKVFKIIAGILSLLTGIGIIGGIIYLIGKNK